MNFMNCSVKHISWGIGTVTEQKDNYIKIILGLEKNSSFIRAHLRSP